MFRELKTDFYKIIKSQNMKFAFLFATILSLVYPISMQTGGSAAADLFSSDSSIPIIVMIVVSATFSMLDFSSGAIKNFYEKCSKIKYVLSKFVMIFIFAVVLSGILFIEHLIINQIFGSGKIFNGESHYPFTRQQHLYGGICRIFMLTFFGALVFMLVMLTRIAVLPVAVALVYQFGGQFIWQGMESIFGLQFGEISNYTIASNLGLIVYPDTHPEKTLIYLAMTIGWTLIFFFVSCVAFKKKSV